THVAKARPFVEAGKSVLLDKPLAGNPRDLRQLLTWARQGARISGGSSLWYTREIRAYLAEPVAQRGEPHTVLCGCGVDSFNYGVHAYSLLRSILGDGAVSVRYLGHHGQDRVQVSWADGRIGVLAIGEAD